MFAFIWRLYLTIWPPIPTPPVTSVSEPDQFDDIVLRNYGMLDFIDIARVYEEFEGGGIC